MVSLIVAIPQPQLFRTKWHPSKMPCICPISVMASPKMANLGTFSLGRALASAFFLGLALPISPGDYGTDTHTLPVQFLIACPFLLWSTLHMELLKRYFAMQI